MLELHISVSRRPNVAVTDRAERGAVELWSESCAPRDTPSFHVLFLSPTPSLSSAINLVSGHCSLNWSADGATLFTGYTDGLIRAWVVGRSGI